MQANIPDEMEYTCAAGTAASIDNFALNWQMDFNHVESPFDWLPVRIRQS